MDRDTNGKNVVITGGAEGLGLAMVKSFLKHGVKLVIILDINEKLGNETTKNLNQTYPGRVVFYKCNVLTDLDNTFDIIIKNHKKVDILVNNAGILDEINIRRTMDINITAVMEWSMKFYEHMRIDKGGSGGTIINVSSIFGYRITAYIPYYHASKYAVIGFSKSLGHQTNFNKTGVRVATLCPGLVLTSLSSAPEIREKDMLPSFKLDLEAYEWQGSEFIGEGTVEIFKQADSGTVWVVEGSRPAAKLDI
ncbi:unnamed protein product, partial [Brenthis ino]